MPGSAGGPRAGQTLWPQLGPARLHRGAAGGAGGGPGRPQRRRQDDADAAGRGPSPRRARARSRSSAGACRSAAVRRSARWAFVAQDHPLYTGFTVRESLRLGRALNRRWDEKVAMALAKRPRLLILDEPLASLDPLARREFTDVLSAVVRDQGLSVLFSSHVVSEL